MPTRARPIACLLLYSAFAWDMASAQLPADETWRWTPASGEEPAKAWIAATGQTSLALAITFPPEQRCYNATLMLTDQERNILPSKQLTVTADGEQFALSASPRSVGGVYEAPPAVFHALKRSRTLRVATTDAEYGFSLAGSAAAINSVWKACEDAVKPEKANERDTEPSAKPTVPTEATKRDSVDERAEERPGEPPVAGTNVRQHVLPIILLIFALGNAFLILDVIGKTFLLPRVSPPAGGQWRRGAAIAGAVGWLVVPLIFYATDGLLGAFLALLSYLMVGLIIATVMKPTVTQYAAGHLIDWVRELRSRIKGVSRGSRLIVDGYRRVARRQAVAPTEKTTDAEILRLFERVGSAFKSVAYQRGEYLRGPRINYIVWKFLQAYEELTNDAFDAYLQQELSRYRHDGLPAVYRNELKF